MPTSGKYDFPGIKKAGAFALKAALASQSWYLFIVKWKLAPICDYLIEYAVNWAANKGLIVLNLGAIYIGGSIDQHAFDKALDEALHQVELSKGKLTDAEKKKIDDAVIAAFRRMAPFTK